MAADDRTVARRERFAALRRDATLPRDAAADPVRRLYERFPYPSSRATAPIRDVANAVATVVADEELRGWRVLDAGCGTGQRLAALAERYPHATFTGIDVSTASVDAARRLMRAHGITNVDVRNGDVLARDRGEAYDLVLCTGVVHHLADPGEGVRLLCSRLAERGLVYVWLYHPFGEFERLLHRELVTLLRGEAGDLGDGLAVVAALGRRLAPLQYGSGSAQPDGTDPDWAADADAFLHPRVRAFRFGEGLDLFEGAAVGWAAVAGCTTQGGSALLDLEDTGDAWERGLTLDARELFPQDDLLRRYRALGKADRLRALELAVKPTGFSIVAGTEGALDRCRPRVAGNRVDVIR